MLKDKILELTKYPLTANKAAHICERDGFDVTGVVMKDICGEVCIVDGGAVRWMSKNEFWDLMHLSRTCL